MIETAGDGFFLDASICSRNEAGPRVEPHRIAQKIKLYRRRAQLPGASAKFRISGNAHPVVLQHSGN